MGDYLDNELERKIREKATGWTVEPQSVPVRLAVSPPSLPVQQSRLEVFVRRTLRLFSGQISRGTTKVWGKTQLSPVKHQGASFACTAFAITSALEDQLILWRADQAKTLSALHAHICIGGKEMNEPWDPGYALEVLQSALIAEETAVEQVWTPERCAITLGSVSLKYRQINDRSSAVAALANGPIVAEMDMWQDLHSFYKAGVYRHVDGDYYGRHTVEVVGVDSEFWVIKNSYGPGWGEEGYARIAIDECNLLKYQAYQIYLA
ncbi:C1 family peptidase [Pseudomonas gingeri]